jgi:LmbE family N-acetylglucosaminyl deacetylase
MNPYLKFVEAIQANLEATKGCSVSGQVEPVVSSAKVLLFSPHPDDECITGLLPLRLMRETGRQIINVPVTFGSRVDRRVERAKELRDACGYLGWTLHWEQANLEPLGLEEIVRILRRYEPRVLFMPHAGDWNARHLTVHQLVMDALKKMPASFSCFVIETEFWGAMDDPNLMVEADAATVADLVAATSLHAGEVARNPYHLLLPAWMQDNVRRGAERVGGAGSVAPNISFATLYRLRKWTDGALVSVLKKNRLLSMGDDLNGIF